jgi:hypothetical protein
MSEDEQCRLDQCVPQPNAVTLQNTEGQQADAVLKPD